MGHHVLIKKTAFKGKHKIQDHWKDNVYHVEGEPYSGLPVFRITAVTGGEKVIVFLQNWLFPSVGNIEWDPEDEVNQQDANDLQDRISADSDNRGSEAKVALTDPKPAGDGKAICV